MARHEAVIGLEVHAQLRTRTKIFCACPATFGSDPNSQTCPVCLGHPGALPVLNGVAVEAAVRGATALGCTLHERSVFARKNYFYPDLPKGYQISQYESPLAEGGSVPIEVGGKTRRIALERFHMEEDAGKSIHDGMRDSDRAAYVDLNRAGIPLVEIVSEPDLRTPEEAYLYLQRLRSILRYTEVCDGNLEEGSLRCDANVSIRPVGSPSLGTRTELKNLNSFRNVQRALEFEIARQEAVLDSGGTVAQQTLLWDASAGETRVMRDKEEAHDYRYFPDPDLMPLLLDRAMIERIRASLPELPAERKARFVRSYGLSSSDAHLLTLERAVADYFERVADLARNPKAAANLVLNDLAREQKSAKRDEGDIPLPAEHMAELIRLVDAGTISNAAARDPVFGAVYRTGRPPSDLVRELGLEQVSDEAVLRQLVERVVSAHPDLVERFRAGKRSIFGHFVGEVMKASGGKANPVLVNSLLRELLG